MDRKVTLQINGDLVRIWLDASGCVVISSSVGDAAIPTAFTKELFNAIRYVSGIKTK